MTWIALFPTADDIISQSVQQIQDNWAFLETTIGTDHYFNSGDVNQSHHRYVQVPNQGADPAVAIDGVFYAKSFGATPVSRPFWRNSSNVSQVPTIQTGSTPIAAGAGSKTLFNLAGLPAFYGFLGIWRSNGASDSCACAFITWDGAVSNCIQLGINGGITEVNTDGFGLIRVKTSSSMTLRWHYFNTLAT